MTTDIIGATDEMNAAVKAAWDAAVIAQGVQDKAKLFFQGTVKDGVLEVGTAATYWARVMFNHVSEGQSTFRGEDPQQRHTAVGLVFVQMFFPLSHKPSWDKGRLIAKAVKKSLAGRTASGTVWFRNPTAKELTPDSSHHRLNVVAEFEYDEIV